MINLLEDKGKTSYTLTYYLLNTTPIGKACEFNTALSIIEIEQKLLKS